MLNAIGQISIPVTEIERSVAFYRDVLGLRFLFQAPPGLGFFDCGGVRIMLDTPTKDQVGKGGTIYFKVDHLDQVCDTIEQRGGDIASRPHLIARMPDHELWMGFVKDPDGNMLGLMEERRQA